MWKSFLLLVLCLCISQGFVQGVGAADNELSDQEQKDGWKLLFNGKDTTGWENRDTGKLANWTAENGELVCKPQHKDAVYMTEQFENFMLSCDWKIAPKGNSGVFIRTSSLKDWINTGMEVQVLDTRESGEMRFPKHVCAALYDVVAPPAEMAMKQDDWNHFDITCDGPKITAKMNGVEAWSIDLKDEKWKTKQGKFNKPYATLPRKGYLMLQDHGGAISFKNVKIKVLPESKPE